MKHLILGRGRFANMQHKVVSRVKGGMCCGGSNAGHGGYVKKDFSDESKGSEGAGIVKKKLKPLKFKM
jgi:hypothetical protein